MPNSCQELTDQFIAYDEDQEPYEIYEYTTIIVAGIIGDPDRELRGLKQYQLADGSPLARQSDDEFSTATRPPLTLRRASS